MRGHRTAVWLVAMALVGAGTADAAEHPSLAKARALYNAADYDAAIEAASIARADPAAADAAALVAARSHLERYRLRTADPSDLDAAREALGALRWPALSPRDRIDLFVGFGQALFLTNTFGAAAELFETALDGAALLPLRDRLLLLDWWATAVDRQAQASAPDRRPALLLRVMARMEDELRQDPANAPASYWLAVSARGAGDVDRAWDAAVAAWVRAPLRPESAPALRGDIDRFVTTVLVPERARARTPHEPAALETLGAEWEAIKEQWR